MRARPDSSSSPSSQIEVIARGRLFFSLPPNASRAVRDEVLRETITRIQRERYNWRRDENSCHGIQWAGARDVLLTGARRG